MVRHARRDAGERFFEAICEGATDLIFSADPDGRLRYANPAFIDALALRAVDPADLVLADLAGPDAVGAVRRALAALRSSRAPVRLETTLAASDGTAVPVDGWLERGAVDGTTMIRGILRNTSTEGKAREELDRLFKLSLDMLCVAGTDGYFKRVNPAFEEVLGYAEAELLEVPFVEFVHPDDRESTQAQVARLARGEPVIDFHNRYRAKDGGWHWLQWRSTPLADRGLIYAIARDATDQIVMQRTLERQTRELARSNADLEQFAAVASHDLRAPLRQVARLARWIEEDMPDALPGNVAGHLRELRDRVERMERLTDALLGYARADVPGERAEEVDPGDLVREVIETLAPPSGFDVRIEGEMPSLTTQRAALEQVFRNLVGNAIDHHDRDEGSVIVRASRDREWIAFTVTDDGPGIPEDEREAVFEMFRTGGRGRRGGGSGMGLAVVKKLVESQEGSISIEPGRRRGTTMRFLWPEAPRSEA